jgi:hypothetical protein
MLDYSSKDLSVPRTNGFRGFIPITRGLLDESDTIRKAVISYGY